MSRCGFFGAALALTCGTLLAACVQDPQKSAPVDTSAHPPAAPEETSYIVVQRGQSLGRIAETYHVPQQAIIAANHLAPPYRLNAGARLAIPGSETQPTQNTKEVASSAARSARPAQATQAKIRHAEPQVIPLDDPALAPPANDRAADKASSDSGGASRGGVKGAYGYFGLDPDLSR
jgi:murein DD-endopeptidase MepM/ murein hydrolase activator NlpD